MQIEPKSLIGKCKISYQYVDYDKDQWTVPVDLTEDRLQKVYDDKSIVKIRIYPKEESLFLELDVK